MFCKFLWTGKFINLNGRVFIWQPFSYIWCSIINIILYQLSRYEPSWVTKCTLSWKNGQKTIPQGTCLWLMHWYHFLLLHRNCWTRMISQYLSIPHLMKCIRLKSLYCRYVEVHMVRCLVIYKSSSDVLVYIQLRWIGVVMQDFVSRQNIL